MKPSAKAVSSSYVTLLVDYLVTTHHVNADQFLRAVGISPNIISKANRFITREQYIKLIEGALHYESSQSLVAALAQKMEITQHGLVGLLAMCGLTLRTALKAVLRFYKLRLKILDLTLLEHDGKAIIRVVPRGDLGAAEQFSIEIILLGMLKTKEQLIGLQDDLDEINITYPAEHNDPLALCIAPHHIVYDQPYNQYIGAEQHLDCKLSTAHAPTYEVLEDQCQHELTKTAEEKDIVAQVAAILATQYDQFPTLEQLAQSLSMSARTLSRHLQKNETSYQQLLDYERITRAKELLTYTDLSITEIALQLYFTDSSHFSKVFKRVVTKSPSEYRPPSPSS